MSSQLNIYAGSPERGLEGVTVPGLKLGWLVGSSAICAAAVASWWLVRQPTAADVSVSVESHASGAQQPAEEFADVYAVKVRRSTLALRAEATGYLEPWRKVEIRAIAAGAIVERRVDNGSRVKAGDLLFRLDDRDQTIELAEARAEYLKVRARYAVDFGANEPADTPAAMDILEIAERRAQEGLLSQKELEEIRRRSETTNLVSGAQRSEVRAATSGLTQAEQRLERALLALERTRILAPFGGRVADLAAEQGQQLAAGERLLNILDDNRLRVEVDVLEGDVVHLRRGTPARVRIPSLDLQVSGSIQTVNPRVSSETGTGRVTVALHNPQHLLISGLFASVELETRLLPDRLLVPASALLTRQGRDLVFRIENGRALWNYVEVGDRSGGLIEISQGLSEGDLIAIGGHFALAHEAPVRTRIGAAPPDDRGDPWAPQ
jgi:HlyD family secretion protein